MTSVLEVSPLFQQEIDEATYRELYRSIDAPPAALSGTCTSKIWTASSSPDVLYGQLAVKVR